MSEPTVIQLRPKPRPPAEQVLLSKKQAAERLGVSERTVERWVRKDAIPHVRLGEDETILRFPVNRLDEWWGRRVVGGE